ncbi:MAG: peptidase dimerization domain-containing protein [Tepidanaerobacteraceae bacterium]
MSVNFGVLGVELKGLGFNVTESEKGLFAAFGKEGCLLRAGVDSVAGEIAYEAAKTLANKGDCVAICLTPKGNMGAKEILGNNSFTATGIFNIDQIPMIDGGPCRGASAKAQYASTARVFVVLHGFTAHGAQPHLGINAVDAAALAMNAINAIKTPYYVNRTVQILSIDAGGSSINMIPDRVSMVVSIATISNEWLEILIDKIKNAIECSAKSIKATAEFEIKLGQKAPDYSNSSAVTALEAGITSAFRDIAPVAVSAKGSDQQEIASIFGCSSACLVIEDEKYKTASINALVTAANVLKGVKI